MHPTRNPGLSLSLMILVTWGGLSGFSCAQAPRTAAGNPAEGLVGPFLGPPSFHMGQVFKGERFPNVVVAVDGTVVVTWGSGSVRARRSEDGGRTWGSVITIAKPGFQGGGTTVDETTGHILAFVEKHHPPAPLSVYRSEDHGKTWSEPITISGDGAGGDLGYPTTVQLDDGSLVTVWYEQMAGSTFAVLRQAHWMLA